MKITLDGGMYDGEEVEARDGAEFVYVAEIEMSPPRELPPMPIATIKTLPCRVARYERKVYFVTKYEFAGYEK